MKRTTILGITSHISDSSLSSPSPSSTTSYNLTDGGSLFSVFDLIFHRINSLNLFPVPITKIINEYISPEPPSNIGRETLKTWWDCQSENGMHQLGSFLSFSPKPPIPKPVLSEQNDAETLPAESQLWEEIIDYDDFHTGMHRYFKNSGIDNFNHNDFLINILESVTPNFCYSVLQGTVYANTVMLDMFKKAIEAVVKKQKTFSHKLSDYDRKSVFPKIQNDSKIITTKNNFTDVTIVTNAFHFFIFTLIHPIFHIKKNNNLNFLQLFNYKRREITDSFSLLIHLKLYADFSIYYHNLHLSLLPVIRSIKFRFYIPDDTTKSKTEGFFKSTTVKDLNKFEYYQLRRS